MTHFRFLKATTALFFEMNIIGFFENIVTIYYDFNHCDINCIQQNYQLLFDHIWGGIAKKCDLEY